MSCYITYKGKNYTQEDFLDFLKTQIPSSSTPNNPAEFVNHSGGAYGGDTMWDQIGREFGVTEHKHYRDVGNTALSQKLRNNKVEATVLTSEQMEEARTQIEKLLGKKFPNTTQGNLQVRNYYQVANADAVYAIANLNDSKTEVSGGTNTAVQLGIKMNKPVYVWDTNNEIWYEYKTNEYGDNGEFKARISAPTLTKNFAGVGTRDIENYSTLDKTTNKWTPRKEYLGDEKAQKAQQAIRDVYENTFNESKETPSQVGQPFNNETSTDTYQYFGAKYEIITVDGVGVQVKDYKGSHQKQQNLLQAYNNNKDIDPQTGRKFRTNTPGQSTNENNSSKYELFPGVFANEGQKTAIDAIEEFLAGDKDLFLLKGRGGTGKTTIVKKTIGNIPVKQVAGATIAYEAKNVLQENMVGYNTFTMASLIGLMPDWAKDGTMFFREKTEAERRNPTTGEIYPLPIEGKKLIIVDEASMIDSFIYEKLLEKKDKDAKILFMGDNVQIPPINSRVDEDGNVIDSGEKDSPVWGLVESGDYVELSERMRQGAESPILPITDLYAENVENLQNKRPGIDNPLKDRNNNFENNEGVLFTADINEVTDQFIEDVRASEDIREAVIVGARNAVVDEINDRVRTKLFETDEAYVIGDRLRVNSPYMEGKDLIYPNGLRVEVLAVKELDTSDLGFKMFELETSYIEVAEDGSSQIIRSFMRTISPKDKSLFNKKIKEMAAKAKALPKGSFESKKAWKQFFDIKNSIVDLGYGYAITAHKVQGSTYNSAYVLEGDIMSFPGGTEQKNRMMYTAVSRPRKKLVIFNPNKVETKVAISKPQVKPVTKDTAAKIKSLFNTQGYIEIDTANKTNKDLIVIISNYVLEELGHVTPQKKLEAVQSGFKLSNYITTEEISPTKTRVRTNISNLLKDEDEDAPISLGGINFTSSGDSYAKNAFTCK